MKQSRPLAVVTVPALVLFVLTASILLPIYFRPFYYAHIGPLQLCEQTGLSEDEIRTAYDEMLDFCLGEGEFSTGCLSYSAEGQAHFEDVRRLFALDWDLMVLSATVLLAVFLLRRRVRCARLGGHSPGFWAGTGLGGSFLVIGALAALDFDRAFVIFHSIFFPGKTNWIFDYDVDQIIRILPQEFFRNCAIAILAALALGCAGMIAWDFRKPSA